MFLEKEREMKIEKLKQHVLTVIHDSGNSIMIKYVWRLIVDLKHHLQHSDYDSQHFSTVRELRTHQLV